MKLLNESSLLDLLDDLDSYPCNEKRNEVVDAFAKYRQMQPDYKLSSWLESLYDNSMVMYRIWQDKQS